MKKVIEIKVEFPDGFLPPKEFSKGGECEECPFFHRYDDGDAECSYVGDERCVCPIKKYFN